MTYGAVALVAGPYIGFTLFTSHLGMSRVEKVLATGKVDRVLKTTRNLRRDELEVAAIT